jgi:uncharacterized membrane protein YgdD (TMEM256/DUF423 family)
MLLIGAFHGASNRRLDFPMTQSTAQRLAALAGFTAVALGAFGAHGLKGILEANCTVSVWQTAALYHLVHAVVLLVLSSRPSPPRWSFYLMGMGMMIFCGSLYLLALSNLKWLGAITPIGGGFFLAGWLVLAFKPRD